MILLAYVACYAFMRFMIEFFRGDFRGEYILGLSPSQLISLLTALAAGAFWIYLQKKEVKNG